MNDYPSESDKDKGASLSALVPPRNPLMTRAERTFLSQEAMCPDSMVPVSTRWEELLNYAPELARGSLSGEWTPVYQYAEKHLTGQRLQAVTEHAKLRYYLYQWLYERALIHTHVMYVEQANCDYWACRLDAKLEALESPTRKVGTRIRHAHQGAYQITWIH